MDSSAHFATPILGWNGHPHYSILLHFSLDESPCWLADAQKAAVKAVEDLKDHGRPSPKDRQAVFCPTKTGYVSFPMVLVVPQKRK